jgi:hypothetical protein
MGLAPSRGALESGAEKAPVPEEGSGVLARSASRQTCKGSPPFGGSRKQRQERQPCGASHGAGRPLSLQTRGPHSAMRTRGATCVPASQACAHPIHIAPTIRKVTAPHEVKAGRGTRAAGAGGSPDPAKLLILLHERQITRIAADYPLSMRPTQARGLDPYGAPGGRAGRPGRGDRVVNGAALHRPAHHAGPGGRAALAYSGTGVPGDRGATATALWRGRCEDCGR